MSRSDKVAFRREFTKIDSGYVGTEDGFFVGDIITLHIDSSEINVTIVVEGKVGRTSDWEPIISYRSINQCQSTDIRNVEYVRVSVFSIAQSTDIVLFGYPVPIFRDEITTIQTTEQKVLEQEKHEELCKIKEELIKLNQYMSIIVGDEI